SVRALGPTAEDAQRYERLTNTLAAGGVLIEEGYPRHVRENAGVGSWPSWGPLARAFHYGTRTEVTTRFLDPDQQGAAFESRRAAIPPPAAVTETGPRIGLPEASDEVFGHRDLLAVLRRRRSPRAFGDGPLPLATFGALLQVGAGITRIDERTATVFTASPSGGGRHPTEIYPY